jgi:hypothetical protein
MRMIVDYIIDYFKWFLPWRYKYHLKACENYGQMPSSYPDWERLIKECNYTVFNVITNYRFVNWRL